MEPEHNGFQVDFPFPGALFSGSILNFGGGCTMIFWSFLQEKTLKITSSGFKIEKPPRVGANGATG